MDDNQQPGPSVEDRLARLFVDEGDKPPEPPPEEGEPEEQAPAQEQDQETPDETPAEDGQAPEEGTPAPADEEVEYEGKAYRVPPELKSALLRQADYTRKTQEVAAQRKQLEEQQKQFEQVEQFRQGQFQLAVQLQAIDQQLDAYAKFDWASLSDSDPSQYLKLDRQYRDLQMLRQQKLAEGQQALQHQQQLTAQQRQSAVQQGQIELAKRVTGWNQQLAQDVGASALKYGFTESEVSTLLDPRFVHVLHDAHQWRRLQDRKPEAKRVVSTAKPIAAPAARTTDASIRAAKDADLRSKLKRTGDHKVAEDLLTARLARKFK
jgi:hypothetical protein